MNTCMYVIHMQIKRMVLLHNMPSTRHIIFILEMSSYQVKYFKGRIVFPSPCNLEKKNLHIIL